MNAWTHYFTFKSTDEFAGYWVEIEATSNKKAEEKMEALFGTWDKHYTSFNCKQLKKCVNGCLARYEHETI